MPPISTSRLDRVINSTKTSQLQSMTKRDMVVFSHLRWEFVTQRPQHLIERFARSGREVLFVEEPIEYTPSQHGTARVFSPAKNVTVIQPRIAPGDFQALANVIDYCSPDAFSSRPLLWFYSPSFVAMADLIPHSVVVYDCMDELSQFKGAAASIVIQERQLLNKADVVFTGGKSLFESKKQLHDNVYCFPSSIDKTHFEKALNKETVVPSDLAAIKQPVVGFYGVIDERLDLDLLARVAAIMPQVSFAMIGPVVKIDQGDLPQAKNIHYLGAKSYSELPAYLKGFSVAFMPFALNEATEFISPTKTLEFMAAYKPIVSTAVYDVKRDYAKEVSIVHTAEEMAQAIAHYISEPVSKRLAREKLQRAVIARTSWDKTAASMEFILSSLLSTRHSLQQGVALPLRLSYQL
jgi:glycosyltransferase involved in cell wall biosynthesis